jgi:hypothetical protein
MRRWITRGLPDSPRREDILVAVDQHDNGWREVDSAPVVDLATGRILDFVSAPDAVRRGVWPRGVRRLSNRPYAAALVAQHAMQVYARYRGQPDWHPFFAEMEAARDSHLRQVATATLSELINDYFFVRIGDLLSLTFCNGWTERQTDVSGYLVHLIGTRLSVTPDPFDGHEVSLEVSARRLSNAAFTLASEARHAFATASTVKVTGTVSGGAVAFRLIRPVSSLNDSNLPWSQFAGTSGCSGPTKNLSGESPTRATPMPG